MAPVGRPCKVMASIDVLAKRMSSMTRHSMCGEEVDAVAVEVAAGAVVVLGGPWVGVTGVDLGIAEWDAGVECVGDRGVPQ